MNKLIIATGGASYSATGSTGDGYNIAEKLGHTITEIKPSLVPLECCEKELCKQLQGLSLRNVSIKINGREIEDVKVAIDSIINIRTIKLLRINFPLTPIFIPCAMPVTISIVTCANKPIKYFADTICVLVYGIVPLY